MAADNLDHADLSAVDFNGLINEDVMQQIWDISNIPLPFSDRSASDATGHEYAEWTQDKLQAVDTDNAAVDGADITKDDTNTGKRVGNRCQIMTKRIAVSTRANEANSIGSAGSVAYQVMMRQRELRRDGEAIFLEPQASVQDDGASTAGRLGGLPSWLTTNTSRGTGGADGGFSGGTVAAPTPGEARGLTETLVRDIAQSVWEQGGNPGVLMSTPSVIRNLSNYMFTSSARIATLQRNEQGMGAATAIGAVNVFLTDFDVVLEMIPNRLQQTYSSGDVSPVDVANVFILDMEMIRRTFLHGYRVEDQAKTGLSEKRQMAGDMTLKILNEEAQGLIADIDPTVPVAQ